MLLFIFSDNTRTREHAIKFTAFQCKVDKITLTGDDKLLLFKLQNSLTKFNQHVKQVFDRIYLVSVIALL